MVIFGDVCGALRQKGVPGELFFTHFLNQSLRRWGWFRFLRCWMNPPPAKGKARRKPCTEKPSARFDEEREVGRPLFYSTESRSILINSLRLYRGKKLTEPEYFLSYLKILSNSSLITSATSFLSSLED